MSKRKNARRKAAPRVTSKTEIEMRWINAWSDLYEIIGIRGALNCQLPDGSIVSVEDCKGWLQESAYNGYLLRVEFGQILGKPGVIASRWKAEGNG
jgi:hypothetical protein